MPVGFGQLFLIALVVVLLFGNFPKLRKDFSQGGVTAIKTLQEGLNKEKEKEEGAQTGQISKDQDPNQPNHSATTKSTAIEPSKSDTLSPPKV